MSYTSHFTLLILSLTSQYTWDEKMSSEAEQKNKNKNRRRSKDWRVTKAMWPKVKVQLDGFGRFERYFIVDLSFRWIFISHTTCLISPADRNLFFGFLHLISHLFFFCLLLVSYRSYLERSSDRQQHLLPTSTQAATKPAAVIEVESGPQLLQE